MTETAEATAHIRIRQSRQRRGNQFYKPSKLESDWATLCGAHPTSEDFGFGDAASIIRAGDRETAGRETVRRDPGRARGICATTWRRAMTQKPREGAIAAANSADEGLGKIDGEAVSAEEIALRAQVAQARALQGIALALVALGDAVRRAGAGRHA